MTTKITQLLALLAGDGVTALNAGEAIQQAGGSSLLGLEMLNLLAGNGAKIGGLTKISTPTITVSTGAYTAGDNIGGKITLTDAMRVSGGTGVLSGITLLDRSNQKPELEIFIFESDPSAATITDNAAFVFSTDDLKVIGKVVVATADWTTTDGKAVAEMSNLNIVVKAVGGAHLYAAIVATGAPDFVATTDFQARFKFFQD